MSQINDERKCVEHSFDTLLTALKGKEVYMLIGHGSKNQFRSVNVTLAILQEILEDIPLKSVFIYFGDAADVKKPDVGLLFQHIAQLRADISIHMIQISAAKSWGVPDFVDTVLWHDDFKNGEHKWGGVYDGKPMSNTAKWASLHEKHPITKIFVFGGGQITLDECGLAKKLGIPIQYQLVERRFVGDGRTLVDVKNHQYGVTHHLANQDAYKVNGG